MKLGGSSLTVRSPCTFETSENGDVKDGEFDGQGGVEACSLGQPCPRRETPYHDVQPAAGAQEVGGGSVEETSPPPPRQLRYPTTGLVEEHGEEELSPVVENSRVVMSASDRDSKESNATSNHDILHTAEVKACSEERHTSKVENSQLALPTSNTEPNAQTDDRTVECSAIGKTEKTVEPAMDGSSTEPNDRYVHQAEVVEEFREDRVVEKPQVVAAATVGDGTEPGTSQEVHNETSNGNLIQASANHVQGSTTTQERPPGSTDEAHATPAAGFTPVSSPSLHTS